jgi:hypothetical protein
MALVYLDQEMALFLNYRDRFPWLQAEPDEHGRDN